MHQTRRLTQAVVKGIEWCNNKMGFIAGILVFLMMLAISYDVLSRNLFSRSTIWALDVVTICQLLVIFIAGGYALLLDAHTKVDVLYNRLSPRTRAVLDVVTSLLGLVFIGILIWQTITMTVDSVRMGRYYEENLRFPIYWLEALVSLGCLLFGFQLIVRAGRAVATALSRNQDAGGHR